MSMKGLFASMNLARWIMVLGGLGSIVLASNGWRLYTQRTEMEAALAPGGLVERTAGNIQYLGKQYTKLRADADREGLTDGQTEPSAYFRGLASNPKVNLGSVDINALQSQYFFKGTKDLQYSIKPQTDKGYARDKIMNYMYMLEQQSRRVKVTQLQLTPDPKRKEWEVGSDLWKWQIVLTSRTKDEAAK